MPKKKIKEIKLPMRFNPGLEKYEPVLPARKAGKNFKYDWKGVFFAIAMIILIIGLFSLAMILLNKYIIYP